MDGVPEWVDYAAAQVENLTKKVEGLKIVLIFSILSRRGLTAKNVKNAKCLK